MHSLLLERRAGDHEVTDRKVIGGLKALATAIDL